MKRFIVLLALLALAAPAGASYEERPEVRAFIRELVDRHGFVEEELKVLFSRVQRADPVLQAILPETQAQLTWDDYRATFLNDKRIEAGIAFWKANGRALARAERRFGVPAQIVVAIIGVETFYGRQTGRWRVVDALTTLAFDYPPRARFFRNELENYLLLARDNGLDVFAVRGSYAGAIGIPQFMPGSARRYAVDFDGDGAIDLRRSAADAIGSVANFLRQHGWQPGGEVQVKALVEGEAWRALATGLEPKHAIADLANAGVQPEKPVASPVAFIDLGSERRLGLHNFYVLTRYNRSALYASVVADLAAELKKGQSAGR